MKTPNSAAPIFLILLGLGVHLWGIFSPPTLGQGALKDTLGRDFSSYYYAADEAFAGGDPWDTDALSSRARKDGTRRAVHPFFYPPPFLVWVAWTPALSLERAFQLWKWLHELAVLGCGWILWRWWRPLGGPTLPAIALGIGLCWGVHYGMVMGQANPIVLALALAGLWMHAQSRPLMAGALVGTAAMLKMAPVLLLVPWALRREWRPVAAAAASAVAWTLVSLLCVSAELQWLFYTQILPQFSTGDYNGLVVKIGMFANHSLPNIWHQVWPGEASALSSTAQFASTVGTLSMLVAAALLTRRSPDTPWAEAARGTLWLTLALLVPVYTYEHHLIQAVPGLILLGLAVASGHLHRSWALGLVFTAAAWATPLPMLKTLSWRTLEAGSPISLAVQEWKFMGLWVVVAGLVTLARSQRTDLQT